MPARKGGQGHGHPRSRGLAGRQGEADALRYAGRRVQAILWREHGRRKGARPEHQYLTVHWQRLVFARAATTFEQHICPGEGVRDSPLHSTAPVLTCALGVADKEIAPDGCSGRAKSPPAGRDDVQPLAPCLTKLQTVGCEEMIMCTFLRAVPGPGSTC